MPQITSITAETGGVLAKILEMDPEIHFSLDKFEGDYCQFDPTIYYRAIPFPHGQEMDEERDHITRWVNFPSILSRDAIFRILDEYGYDTEGDYCRHSYDCCGNFYAREGYVQDMGTHKAYLQHAYRNV